MNVSEEILMEELETLKEDLVQKHRELGKRASGNWERELEVSIQEKSGGVSGKILGEDYTIALIEGRPPGEFPELDQIEKWVQNKGLVSQVRDNISVSSLAFLIARKIAREGTEIYKQGGSDLIDSVVTPERLQGIIDKVSVIYVDVITTTILDSLRELEAA